MDGGTRSGKRTSAAAMTRHRARAAVKSPEELRGRVWYRWKERELYYSKE